MSDTKPHLEVGQHWIEMEREEESGGVKVIFAVQEVRGKGDYAYGQETVIDSYFEPHTATYHAGHSLNTLHEHFTPIED